MSVIDKEEKKRLSIMYEGDKPRDASDKVRGFLFQDYVAISCLLQEHVDYVCLCCNCKLDPAFCPRRQPPMPAQEVVL